LSNQSTPRSVTRRGIEARRQHAVGKRHPPVTTHKLIITPDGRTCRVPPIADGADRTDGLAPTEIWVYLTDPRLDGHIHHDLFELSRVVTRRLATWAANWADSEISLYIISFNAALIRSGLFDRFDRIAQKARPWQVTLATDGTDLASMAMIDKVLGSRIDRLNIYPARIDEPSLNRRALDASRDIIELRRARGQNRPTIVCRACEENPATPELKQWARQTGIDRLEQTDRQTEETQLWGLLSRNSAEPA